MAKNAKIKPAPKKSVKKPLATKPKAKVTAVSKAKVKPAAKAKPVKSTAKTSKPVKKVSKPAMKVSIKKTATPKVKLIKTKASAPIKKVEPKKPIKPIQAPKSETKKVETKPIVTVKAKINPTLENKKPVTKTTTKIETPPTTNGKTRYSDKELAEFKQLIDEKLGAARKELNYLQEQIVEMNENNSDVQGSDWFDDSSIHAEVELLNNMAIRQRQFIQNLENALIRIENKTYGICTITGSLIDKKRLLLVPHATKSIEAKHIEQSTMVPDINQVAPDERVLRRAAEGKTAKKSPVKKSKGKSSRDFDDEDGDDSMEAPVEEMDLTVEAED